MLRSWVYISKAHTLLPAYKHFKKPFNSSSSYTDIMDDTECIARLGIGRGLDATDPEPWQHLSTHQVHEITDKNIVITNDSKLEHIKEDIKSVVEHNVEIESSVKKSGIASIGLFGELHRSVTQTKKMVGTRILTRKIAFQSDLDDIPVSNIEGQLPPFFSTPPSSDMAIDFEQKFCGYILKCIRYRQRKKVEKLPTGFEPEAAGLKGKPVEELNGTDQISRLADYINSVDSSQHKEVLQEIAKDCAIFVKKGAGGTRPITHYVYQLKLGALEYEILTQAEYEQRLKLGVEASGEDPTTVGVEARGGFERIRRDEHKATRGRSVGKIEDGVVTVERVIGVEIKPVHTLLKQLSFLRQALREAESAYIREKQDLKEGPFRIWCNDEDNKIYWQVHERTTVVGTKAPENASLFYLDPSTSEEHPNEFSIVHFKHQINDHNGYHQSRMLKAHVNLFGHNSGPLKVKEYVKHSDKRLTLHLRRSDESQEDKPEDIRSWVKGEPFFFKCTRRRGLDGYVAMTVPLPARSCHGASAKPEFDFITKCVRQKSEHGKPNTWLLFYLEHHEEECEEKPQPITNRDLMISRGHDRRPRTYLSDHAGSFSRAVAHSISGADLHHDTFDITPITFKVAEQKERGKATKPKKMARGYKHKRERRHPPPSEDDLPHYLPELEEDCPMPDFLRNVVLLEPTHHNGGAGSSTGDTLPHPPLGTHTEHLQVPPQSNAVTSVALRDVSVEAEVHEPASKEDDV